VAMTLHVVSPNKLQLTISDLGDQPKRKFSTIFDAKGFGVGADAFFKRVDAIDQNGTEGKHVRRSASHVENSLWRDTILTRKNGEVQPLQAGFRRVIDDPPGHAQVTSTHQQRLHGGERVDLEAADNKKK
jgi:hypothetical protein